MNFRRPLTMILSILLGPGPAAAQTPSGAVAGRTVDAATQQSVEGASVLVVGTNRGAVSGTDGRFRIEGVPAGPHQLRASMIGYGEVEQTVAISAGQTAEVLRRGTRGSLRNGISTAGCYDPSPTPATAGGGTLAS